MKICALQMRVEPSDRAANFAKAEKLIRRAMSGLEAADGPEALSGPDLPGGPRAPGRRDLPETAESMKTPARPDVLLLPELWDLGFISPRVRELADEGGRAARSFLSGQAARHGVNIVGGSISRAEGGRLWNTALVFDRRGECLACYDKIHLFSPGQEADYFQPGSRLALFELDGVSAGLMTCYDLRFPELSRSLALKGARVLFNCTAWPFPRENHWRLLCQARAIENQVYLAGCNCVGQVEKMNFCGHSMLVAPGGEILAEAGTEEEIIGGRCDFQGQDELRAAIPVFKDRRPEVYELGHPKGSQS